MNVSLSITQVFFEHIKFVTAGVINGDVIVVVERCSTKGVSELDNLSAMVGDVERADVLAMFSLSVEQLSLLVSRDELHTLEAASKE